MCSIIRPTETEGAAMGALTFLTADGLFRGQSPAFFAFMTSWPARRTPRDRATQPTRPRPPGATRGPGYPASAGHRRLEQEDGDLAVGLLLVLGVVGPDRDGALPPQARSSPSSTRAV